MGVCMVVYFLLLFFGHMLHSGDLYVLGNKDRFAQEDLLSVCGLSLALGICW